MTLASLAAAATVYDTIDEVARDVRVTPSAARAALHVSNIASVDRRGRVSMSIEQSMRAADALDGELGW